MYELLQAQERACAKICFGTSWKWSSVFMGFESGWDFDLGGISHLVFWGQTGAEMVASSEISFHSYYSKTTSLLLACTSLRTLFME
jgi:hypothetical protein